MFIHLKFFAVLIRQSAVELDAYVAVTDEDVDGDEVVADWLKGRVKVDSDDEMALAWKCLAMQRTV